MPVWSQLLSGEEIHRAEKTGLRSAGLRLLTMAFSMDVFLV
ncbi:MAG: hypothetical protein OJF50_002286 [Nitrospira sp.]|nr:hypothetical protein [Nitrospira sp.]